MEDTPRASRTPDQSGGFSVVLVEGVWHGARQAGLTQEWTTLWVGRPTRRRTSYRAEHRVLALLSVLTAGVPSVSSANQFLRPNGALQAELGGRFPDQGTLHRWLEQATSEQVEALRSHLHQAVREHGRFWQRLRAGEELLIDLDAQGFAAHGPRFERAADGWMGDAVDRGYQRFTASVAATGEVLDEAWQPGNAHGQTYGPTLIAVLSDIITDPADRARLVLRGDGHFGTIENILAAQREGFGYVVKLTRWALNRLVAHVELRPGTPCDVPPGKTDCRVTCWDVPEWTLVNKDGPTRQVTTRAVVFREESPDGQLDWWAVAGRTRQTAQELWPCYRDRGGTIEAYHDQSERAYRLDLLPTGRFDGLAAFHLLVGLSWNLIRWSTAALSLPPATAPQAPPARWMPAPAIDLSRLMIRASHSGLRLSRAGPGQILEIEDTAHTTESKAWLIWLHQHYQRRLPLAA